MPVTGYWLITNHWQQATSNKQPATNKSMISITESESLYHDLEKMSVRELLESINTEDQKVPLIVRDSIP